MAPPSLYGCDEEASQLRTALWIVALIVLVGLVAAGCQKPVDTPPAGSGTTAGAKTAVAGAPPAPPKTGMVADKAAETGTMGKPTDEAKPASAGGVAWEPSYEKALEKAKAENKLVMADFTAEWCTWCKKLESDVYSKPDVAAKINQFVPVMVDVDKLPDLAKQFNVTGMPYIAVIDPDGNVLVDQKGYCEAPAFMAFLDKGLAAKKK
jgi:thiol:disulfide interchange protein